MESQARQAMTANLIIHGLPEDSAENAAQRVSALFASSGRIAAVSEARCLGAPSASRSMSRPLIARFSSLADEHAALQHCGV